jgi:hypothetical protein
MRPTRFLIPGLLAVLPITSSNAKVLVEWTFDTGATSTDRLASGSPAAGALVSGLSFNQSFSDFGPGSVPNDIHDGFGFGGNLGDQVIFLHRAEYFDASEVPLPRPTEDAYTAWGTGPSQGTGADLGADSNAPIVFMVTSDAISTVTIESITVDYTSGGGIIFGFQEAGSTSGAAVTLNGANPLLDVPLNAPVIIGPDETKTFTINVDSGALNSLHNIDGISLNGSVAREEHPPLAEWTFDSGESSADLLASSDVAKGAIISGLSFNDSFTNFGPEAVPKDLHDGFGFGGNRGDRVIFLHRATYFDSSAVPDPRPTVADYTSWGIGSNQGTGADLSSNGNAAISFTVEADELSIITVDSLTIDFTSGGACIWQIQEAGAAEGAQGTLNPGNPLLTVALNTPVVIGAGETKTFTINVNSGALNSFHNIDGLSLNGFRSPSNPIELAITKIDYAPEANTVTLTWRKTLATSYIAKYSLDMTGWEGELDDDITADRDENPEDVTQITLTIPLPVILKDAPGNFFRIEIGE